MKLNRIATIIALACAPSVGLRAATIGTVDFNSNTTAVFGSGNPNGSWVSTTNLGVTPEIRFKNRTTGDFGYDGAGTYSFTVGTQVQFEWSAVSDTDLSQYVFVVETDGDPTVAISGLTFSINTYLDNSFGTSATPSGAGVEGTWASLAGDNTIAQNSQREAWMGVDRNIAGTYTFSMTAYLASDTAFANPIARTEATLNFVPEPSAALLGAIGAVGLLRRRRRW
jgi:hypothetical protein